MQLILLIVHFSQVANRASVPLSNGLREKNGAPHKQVNSKTQNVLQMHCIAWGVGRSG